MTNDTSVLIVDDDSIFRMDLRDMLRMMGYLVVGEARDAQRALTLARKLHPDLVIMAVQLPGAMDGIAAAEVLLGERIAAVLLLTPLSDIDLAPRAAEAGATGYLPKPFSEDMLRLTIHIALSRFRQIQSLQQEVFDLREELETRQIIERARGMLMHVFDLTEDEALSRMRTASMNSNKSLRAIAEAVILARQVGTRPG